MSVPLTQTNRFLSLPIVLLAALTIALLSATLPQPQSALVIGVGLFFVGLVTWRPAIAVYAMALVVPLSFMVFKILGPETKVSFEKPIGVVAVLGLAISLAATRRPLERDKTTTLFALYLAACLLSIFFCEAPKDSAAFMAILLMLFVFYIVVINVIRDLPALNGVLFSMMLGTVAAAVIAIWESKSDTHLFEVEYEGSLLWEGAERVWSTVGDANFLALILMSALPVSYFAFIAARNFIMKIVFLAVAAVLSMGIFVSLSRGGLLALFVIAALIFIRNFRYRFTWVLTAAILVTGAFMIPHAVWTRLGSVGDYDSDASIYQRVHILKSGVAMFRDHMVFGVGVGNFPIVYQDYRSMLEGRETRAAHNSVLEVAAETGLIGLAAFLALFCYALWNCHVARRIVRNDAPSPHTKWMIAMADGIQIGLIGQLVCMCFISALWVKSFWITIALTVCLKKIAQNRAYGATPAVEEAGTPTPLALAAAAKS